MGGSAGPTASTDYMAEGFNELVTCTGGTGVSITIKDDFGNTISSGLSCSASMTPLPLPVGYKVNYYRS